MNYILYGTDARMKYLAGLLHRQGHLVFSWEGVRGAHVTPLSSPLEVSLPVRLVLPLSLKGGIVHQALATLPLGSIIFGGECPTDEESRGILVRRALRWVDLSADEDYCTENAALTAEGALAAIIEHSPAALADTRVGIAGSGRVSQALICLLRKLGCEVTVCARNEKLRKHLRKMGCRTLALPVPEKKRRRLSSLDLFLNTVPVPGIIDASIIDALPCKTPILELASGRENIDLAAAEARGCPVVALPALPGRYTPKTAAEILFSAITKPEKDEKS